VIFAVLEEAKKYVHLHSGEGRPWMPKEEVSEDRVSVGVEKALSDRELRVCSDTFSDMLELVCRSTALNEFHVGIVSATG
jgi:hypothetical protein